MDVKLVTVLAVLAVVVSPTSENLFLRAFNCCTEISNEVPRGILQRLEKFEIQQADGLCHLEAIILHIKDRKFCVSPRMTGTVERWMKMNKHKIHRKKPHGGKHKRPKNIKKKEKQQ